MAFSGAGACLDACLDDCLDDCLGAGCTASGPGLGSDVLGPPATGAASRRSGCPDRARHESGPTVGDGNDPAASGAAEPAHHCAPVDRDDLAGGAFTGARSSKSGGAVADGALRQGSAGHQRRAGVAGVRRQARRHRHVQADPRGARRDAEHRAAARQLRRPRRARPGQRGAGGEPEGGDRSRGLRASGRRTAHRRPRRL